MVARFGRCCLAALACIWAVPAGAVDLAAELTLVSDYRYRGLSLSDRGPSAQASIDFEHGSGLYANVWMSTIEEQDFAADVEIDLTAGYALDLVEGLSLDLSATYYVYPGESGSNYAEATARIEAALGPAVAFAGLSVVPPQHGTRDDDGVAYGNGYAFVGASYELPRLPVTLAAQLGYERGYFDEVENGGKWDWCLRAEATLSPFRLGAAYVGSSGRVANNAIVASIALLF